jgi:hypothetical protein
LNNTEDPGVEQHTQDPDVEQYRESWCRTTHSGPWC